MSYITLRFTTKWPYNIASFAIARLTGSRDWSHVMVLVGGTAFEANMIHGCRAAPIDEAMKGVRRYQDMHVPVPDFIKSVNFGMAQDGKPYDWAGAIGLPLLQSDDWADDTKWWCSEFAFAMLMAGGAKLLDPSECKRVTPNDLHQCDFEKEAIVIIY